MNKETVGKLIEENLTNIFAWSMSKLYKKSEAEDLAGDIICAVLESADRLKNDDAFYGYLWRIANNMLVSKLRKKRHDTVELDEQYIGVYCQTPEDDYIQSEQIMLLRRELSLLSDRYRRAAVLFYIYGKSCSEISAELDISAEMVRYYLFKTRKILKEGVDMTREFGTKSYDPHVFRIDFWGENNSLYWDLFKKASGQLPTISRLLSASLR